MTLGATWTFVAALAIMTGLIAAQHNGEDVFAPKDGQAKLACSHSQGTRIKLCEFTATNSDGTSNVMITTYHPDKTNTPYDKTGVMMTLVEDLDHGKCTLILDNVQPEISGKISCSLADMDKNKEKYTFNLIVQVKPTLTEIFYNDERIPDGTRFQLPENGFDENLVITLGVKAERGIPAATGHWEIEGEFTPNENITVLDEGVYKTTVSKVTFQISKNDRKPEKSVTYTSQHGLYPEGKSIRKISIGYSYETRNAEIKPQSFGVEGEDVVTQLTCIADGIPKPNVEWQWASERDGHFEKYEENLPNTLLNDQINTTRKGFYICCAGNDKNNNVCVKSSSVEVNGKGVEVPGNEEHSTNEAGTIAGIVVGSLILVAVIVGLSLFTYRRNLLCFKGHEGTTPTHNPSSVENGGKHQQTINSSEYTKDKDGDQNDNKQQELVYAQLDLPQSQGNNAKMPKAEEKTEYAQIKFQPKENQV